MLIEKVNRAKQSKSLEAKTLAFESATAEILAQRQPVKERATLYVLAAMIVFIIVFISVVHLDRIVSADGRVVPISGAITVQPLEKAIINRVLVSVGEYVKKGQVLATLDPTFVEADLIQLKQKVANLDAQRRRMEAEEAGQPFRAIPNAPYDALQLSLAAQRSAEYASGVSDFDQRIRSTEAQVVGIRKQIADYRNELKIATEAEDMYHQLADADIATRLQVIAVEDQKLQIVRNLSEQENNLDSTLHLLESLKEQRQVFIKKWHDDNLSALVTAKDSLAQAQDDFTKGKKMTDLVKLESPEDAIVLSIPQLGVGGVAMDAQPLFSLMPVDAALEVDAQIDSKDSGFVNVGDPVTLKFDAYKFLEHGTGSGKVKTISQDSFTEERNQDTLSTNTTPSASAPPAGSTDTRSPYFDCRIQITGLHLHDVPPDTRIIPGMTLHADIVVGRRTILWYLVGGALRSGSEAMHEP
jgi:hemolysin D